MKSVFELAAAQDAANVTITPANNTGNGNLQGKPNAAYAFINGYFVNDAGERFYPSVGIRVLNKDAHNSEGLRKFLHQLTQLDEVEVTKYLQQRGYEFKYTAVEGNLSSLVEEKPDLDSLVGGMLDASMVSALMKIMVSADDKAKYVHALRFGGRVLMNGKPKPVFKAPEHSFLEEHLLTDKSKLLGALEALSGFTPDKGYNFVPTGAALAMPSAEEIDDEY